MDALFDRHTMICRIEELERAVRDHINTHRYQVELLDDATTWNQICSSLDVIGDALLAIRSYVEAPFPTDSGLRYIFTYGVLQALFLQQDALSHLAEALNVGYKRSETLAVIRRTRNAAIGHPTKQSVGEGKLKTRYHNYVSRISMTKAGFDLMRHSESEPYSIEQIDLSSAIDEQLSAVAEGYELIQTKLLETDQMYKKKFKEKRLVDCFPNSMAYHISKVSEGVHHDQKDFALTNLKIIRESYDRFRQGLVERRELNSYVEFDLNDYFYAIDRLNKYFSSKELDMSEQDARILLSYLRSQHDRFVEIAREVDIEYQL